MNLGVLYGRNLLWLAGGFHLGEFNGALLLLVGELQPRLQLLLEIGVAHLLEDIGVSGLVDREGLAEVGADDL